MREYELWFIVANISNETKIELIKKYNNEENIYNNIDSIDNCYIYKGSEYTKLKSAAIPAYGRCCQSSITKISE